MPHIFTVDFDGRLLVSFGHRVVFMPALGSWVETQGQVTNTSQPDPGSQRSDDPQPRGCPLGSPRAFQPEGDPAPPLTVVAVVTPHRLCHGVAVCPMPRPPGGTVVPSHPPRGLFIDGRGFMPPPPPRRAGLGWAGGGAGRAALTRRYPGLCPSSPNPSTSRGLNAIFVPLRKAEGWRRLPARCAERTAPPDLRGMHRPDGGRQRRAVGLG